MNFDEMIARAEIWADEQLAKNPAIKELMEEEDAKLHSESGRELGLNSGQSVTGPAPVPAPDGS